MSATDRQFTRSAAWDRAGDAPAQVPDHAAGGQAPKEIGRVTADPTRRPVRRKSPTLPGAMPEMHRISMAPERLDHRWIRRPFLGGLAKRARRGRRRQADVMEPPPWRSSARRRRWALSLLVLGQTAVATGSLMQTFPMPELTGLQVAILGNFALLFSWISFSFWSNVAAFWTLWRQRRVHSLTLAGADTKQPLRSRTAVVMPVCNEEAVRCFAGLEATYRSLASTGEGESFDFYVLSDSSHPERQADEERAWSRTCRSLNAFGRLFYRRRRVNIKRKSGNIGDFLRRWGRKYDYMVVLDADSVMSGETLVALVRLMERSPRAGIIQTTPATVNGRSLFARVQQFANRCYGPLFSASLHFWQLGESYYWGHNAILRVAPFVKHCGLARLPGEPPLGGEILSHDFVEAALMGRADWEVWIAQDLPGSYEEGPPTLLDELKRDRRWCQGNLQHLRLLPSNGFKTGHRAIFCMGVMAYVSALLWLGFLLLSNAELAIRSLGVPQYFAPQPSLFPAWPRWHPEWAIALASTTAALLFLPKLFSLLLILKERRAHLFGGAAPLAASIILEILVSTVLAPIRMWFHAKFVCLSLMGRPIQWTAQRRTGEAPSWAEATRAHGFATCIAVVWIAWLLWLDATGVLWLLPVATALLFSTPLSVASSLSSLGSRAKRRRLFLTPEEQTSMPVLGELNQALARSPEIYQPRSLKLPGRSRSGWSIGGSAAHGAEAEKPFTLV